MLVGISAVYEYNTSTGWKYNELTDWRSDIFCHNWLWSCSDEHTHARELLLTTFPMRSFWRSFAKRRWSVVRLEWLQKGGDCAANWFMTELCMRKIMQILAAGKSPIPSWFIDFPEKHLRWRLCHIFLLKSCLGLRDIVLENLKYSQWCAQNAVAFAEFSFSKAFKGLGFSADCFPNLQN